MSAGIFSGSGFGQPRLKHLHFSSSGILFSLIRINFVVVESVSSSVEESNVRSVFDLDEESGSNNRSHVASQHACDLFSYYFHRQERKSCLKGAKGGVGVYVNMGDGFFFFGLDWK